MPHDRNQPDTDAGPESPARFAFGVVVLRYGGLDLAVEEVFDAETAWFSEINPVVARECSPATGRTSPVSALFGVDYSRSTS